jgi:hypothetical protein
MRGRNAACLLVALLAFPSLAQDLASARSLAVVVRVVNPFGEVPAGFTDTIRARFVDELRKRKRFEVVDDPARAEAVALYLLHGPQWVERRKQIVVEAVGSSLVIVKGGAGEHWDAGPLWMRTDLEKRWDKSVARLLGTFHREAAKAPRQLPPLPVAERGYEPHVFLTCADPHACDEPFFLNGGTRWKHAGGPAGADYVVVWFNNRLSYNTGMYVITERLSGFLIFRGREPDWSDFPLVAAIRPTAGELREPLETAVWFLTDPRTRRPDVRSVIGATLFDSKPDQPLGGVMAAVNASRGPRLFEPEPGVAVVYIARESDGLAGSTSIAVDGEPLFDIERLTFNKATVLPGIRKLTASISGSPGEQLILFTEAGQVYFVMVEGTRLTNVDGFDGSRILSVLKP